MDQQATVGNVVDKRSSGTAPGGNEGGEVDHLLDQIRAQQRIYEVGCEGGFPDIYYLLGVVHIELKRLQEENKTLQSNFEILEKAYSEPV